jgi:hypothetical protein
MSLATVKNEWSLFQDLWEIWTAALEEKIVLNSPDSPVRSFPKNDKRQWPEWIQEVKEVLSVRENLEVTDTALREGTDLLAAHHRAAAAVSVSVPSDDDVKKLTENLELVNKEVQKDQRFHAALDIGEALAGAIKQASAA